MSAYYCQAYASSIDLQQTLILIRHFISNFWDKLKISVKISLLHKSRHHFLRIAYNIFNSLNNCNIHYSHQLRLFINAFRLSLCLKIIIFLMFLFFASFENLFIVVFAYIYIIANSRDSTYSAVLFISVFVLTIS